jgi:RND family efflux transporter MFP subunit
MKRDAAVRTALCAVVVAAAGCGGHESAPAVATKGPDLVYVRAAAAPAVREQAFDGVLEAVNTATVSAQASGRIVELPVDVDSTVSKGDVIARLRDTEPRARLDASQAALREAQAAVTEAQADYARIKEVFDKKLIAQAQMDRATAARDAAQARLAQAQAALAGAQEQEEHALVRAPYAGIVTARQVQVGELASPGQPLVTMLSLDRLRAVVDVPQQFIAALRSASAARVVLPDGNAVAAGAIHIFPYADEHTHTFRVRVELPEAGTHAIYPGELVKVAFAVGEEPALSVPSTALAHRGEVTGLYVADEQQRLQFRAVRAGRSLPDGVVEILAGLSAGEPVAADPIAAAARLRQQEGASP